MCVRHLAERGEAGMFTCGTWLSWSGRVPRSILRVRGGLRTRASSGWRSSKKVAEGSSHIF